MTLVAGVLLGVATTRFVMGVFFATSSLNQLRPWQFFGIAFWIGFSIKCRRYRASVAFLTLARKVCSWWYRPIAIPARTEVLAGAFRAVAMKSTSGYGFRSTEFSKPVALNCFW